MSLKIAIAQINVTVGDFAGNRERIVDFAERARRQGADLLLTPELALCGYPPEDLLLRDDFCAACDRELDDPGRQPAWHRRSSWDTRRNAVHAATTRRR
jgi:predicted amidohydrolase